MRIKWYIRKGSYLPGNIILKDEFGFYKLSHSTYTPKDVACFSWYAYVYRKIREGVPTQEWCVRMDDGKFMEIEAAKEFDRQDCV